MLIGKCVFILAAVWRGIESAAGVGFPALRTVYMMTQQAEKKRAVFLIFTRVNMLSSPDTTRSWPHRSFPDRQ